MKKEPEFNADQIKYLAALKKDIAASAALRDQRKRGNGARPWGWAPPPLRAEDFGAGVHTICTFYMVKIGLCVSASKPARKGGRKVFLVPPLLFFRKYGLIHTLFDQRRRRE